MRGLWLIFRKNAEHSCLAVRIAHLQPKRKLTEFLLYVGEKGTEYFFDREGIVA